MNQTEKNIATEYKKQKQKQKELFLETQKELIATIRRIKFNNYLGNIDFNEANEKLRELEMSASRIYDLDEELDCLKHDFY